MRHRELFPTGSNLQFLTALAVVYVFRDGDTRLHRTICCDLQLEFVMKFAWSSSRHSCLMVLLKVVNIC